MLIPKLIDERLLLTKLSKCRLASELVGRRPLCGMALPWGRPQWLRLMALFLICAGVSGSGPFGKAFAGESSAASTGVDHGGSGRTCSVDGTGNRVHRPSPSPALPVRDNDTVLMPWSPIRPSIVNSTGITVSVWGRSYHFNGPLPDRVISQGREVLAAPVQLVADTGSGEAIVQWSHPQVAEVTPAHILLTSTATLGSYSITATSRVEYDGFVWTKLSFSAPTASQIDRMRLVIPIREDHATFYQAPTNRHMWWPTKTLLSPWLGYMFAMNDYAGFQWMAESDQYWHAADPGQVLEVTPISQGRGQMIVHFIRDPVVEPTQYEMAFGFMATPVKPRPQRWRGIGRVTTSTFRAKHPDKFRNIDLIYGPWSFAPGWIFPSTWYLSTHENVPWDPNKPTLDLPFVSGTFLGVRPYNRPDELIPTWEANKETWASEPFPTGYKPSDKFWNSWPINPTPSYVDYMLNNIECLFRYNDVDGLYFDGITGQDRSANLKAGFGYVKLDGTIRATYPILAGRDYLKRLNRVIQKYRGYQYYIFPVAYTQLWMPLLSMVQLYYEGEILYWTDMSDAIRDKGIRAGLSDDRLRTLFSQRQTGLVFIFDARRILEAAKTPAQVRQMIGLLLINDVWDWGNESSKTVSAVAAAVDPWDQTDPEIVYHPYFDAQPAVASGDRSMASLWNKAKQHTSLIVVMNDKDEDRTLTLTIDVTRLGYRPTKALDAEAPRSKPLALTEDGRISLPVKARNMRIVILK